MTDDSDPVLANFRWQAAHCGQLGSALSQAVLDAVAADIAADGVARAVVETWPGDPFAGNLATRFLGGLHRLVLDGHAPDLAAHYPSCDGTWSGGPLTEAVAAALDGNQQFLTDYITLPPQTNEVGRAAALHGGFLAAAAATRLPLALREIGASAGLNLLWDQFRYVNQAYSWKMATHDVWIETNWEGEAPDTTAPVQIADRAGCDIAPLDVRRPDDARRLESYVWADQTERLTRLRGAIAVAQHADVRLDEADAETWLRAELAEPVAGVCTVIFHSIFWQYMPGEKQAAVRGLIESAGAARDDRTPLAWLRLEPDDLDDYPRVRLTLWPGGTEQLLGTAHFHGTWVKWGAAGQKPVRAAR